MKQQAFLGTFSIKELLPSLQKHVPQHIFLVRGKKSYETCGAKPIIKDILKRLYCRVTEFYDFEENPKIEDLERGLLLLRESQASVILAVGGGSVLDMSKLIRFFYSYSGGFIGKEFKKKCELLPLIALPTTAGTGSEATHFAVLYKDKVKYSVEHDDILPDTAIVYPPFTYNNQKYLTACTGFDALAQGIEAYWSVNATVESDEYAEKAIKLLWANLPLAVNTPTNDVRDKVSEGAYWAGRAINITKTTAPHAFSYPFTTFYGYPHGHAVALTLPFFLKYNYVEDEKCLCDSLDICVFHNKMRYLYGLLNSSLEEIHNDILAYIAKLGMSNGIHEATVNKELILSHINISRISNNPRVLSYLDLILVINYINSNGKL